MAMKRILNLGAGPSEYGTDRMDIYKTPNITCVWNMERTPWPYADNTFDEVFLKNVFEHTPNPGKLLLEIKRVLKKGGKVKIITDNGGCILFHYNRVGVIHANYEWVPGRFGEGLDRHYIFFQPEHIRNFFEWAGMKPVRYELSEWIDEKGLIDNGWKNFISKIGKLFIGKRLAYPEIYAEAEKI